MKNRKKKELRLWEKLSKRNKFESCFWSKKKIEEFEEIVEEYTKDKKVLDLGCGTGILSSMLTKSFRLVGVDISTDLLNIAKGRHKLQSLIRGDAEFLPLRKNSFDVVIVAFLLHHLENIDKCLVEIKRILVNTGILIILEPNPTNFYVTFKQDYLFGENTFLYSFIKNSLNNSDFNIIKKITINFLPFESLSFLENIIRKLPLLNRFGGTLILIAKNLK